MGSCVCHAYKYACMYARQDTAAATVFLQPFAYVQAHPPAHPPCMRATPPVRLFAHPCVRPPAYAPACPPAQLHVDVFVCVQRSHARAHAHACTHAVAHARMHTRMQELFVMADEFDDVLGMALEHYEQNRKDIIGGTFKI